MMNVDMHYNLIPMPTLNAVLHEEFDGNLNGWTRSPGWFLLAIDIEIFEELHHITRNPPFKFLIHEVKFSTDILAFVLTIIARVIAEAEAEGRDLLAEMADLHQIRVRVFIDEPEIGALQPGEPVKITWDALPNRSWLGKTETTPKQVVARGSRSVGELLCAVENDKLELLPNINVNVRINSKERSNVLTVPRGAVGADGARRFVFVVKKNEFGVGKSMLEKRDIAVGIADATRYEVTSGLSEGEIVALPGDVDLRDGMRVNIVNVETTDLKGQLD
jgi:hypothetical protein